MILADKIISLRKKAGWSQEELAQQLGVTRQSVSKWEGAQSVPDLEKLLQMSRLFGVSTDYLLKDELELAQPAPEGEAPALRRVTMEQASRYLELRRADAPKLALAVFLCVISPVMLIALSAMSQYARFHVSESAAAGFGLCVLLVLVAAAVAIFLSCGARAKEFAFLESEPFETEYGVEGMVREREKAYAPTYSRLNILGTVLCIVSALPLFAAMCIRGGDYSAPAVCLLLLIAGTGCIAFVHGGTYHAAMEKLLEEGDYSRSRKAASRITGTVSACYWLVVTAIFLFYTFGPNGNAQPQSGWIIWAVAGVLFGALMAALKLIRRKDR